ncbi:DNA recombination protein RmuC [Pasteurellaceae bacterium HPA106]|uniref:DNA recombination protein RmuC n=1 Tax=Spirabiliibacterium pneumoniae TaxID=221400 RepID=UPI001AACD4BD|nr:DNA recombination protein RmuC [Spirabiliibacterium pneumoniae]MBE2896011.1 DNA recombination protein RmuC [Spirabiliibacterium pneumoniae]
MPLDSLQLTQLACAVLVLVVLILFFWNAKRKRDSQELRADLNKTIADFNQLAQKYEQLQSHSQQLQSSFVQAQTRVEGLQTSLGERDEKIQYLQKELDEEQARNEAIGEQITALKERFGAANALAQSLQSQLERSHTQMAGKDQQLQNLEQELGQTQRALMKLQTSLEERELHFTKQQQNFEQTKMQLTQEFQNLANRILEEKSQRFQQHNQSALEGLLKPFREQIDSFQKRVNEVHSESIKGQVALESEIKKVLDIGLAMSQEANNLTTALKGEKKTTGNWGEMQLERSLQLAGLVAGEHYDTQASFKDVQGNRRLPDFVVKLPDDKHLIIDSKMSLVAYESAVSCDSEAEQQHFLREHVKAVRQHVNELAQKDYSNLIGMRSPNFVLMFIGLEPAYIEALKADHALFNEAYNKNVIIVSHTTLMPILRTVANLWRIERGNSEAQEISARAGELYNQVSVLAERLQKLGNSLSAVSNHYNSTVTALVGTRGLYSKVEQFKTLSSKVTKTLPELEPLQNVAEHERLNVVKADEQA